MGNTEQWTEVDIKKDGIVDLYTVPEDTSVDSINVGSNVLLFQKVGDEYTIYRGNDDGSVINIMANSANKLKTPVKIFGQLFDGTKELSGITINPISGDIEGVGNLKATGDISTNGDIVSGKNIYLNGNISGAKDISMNGALSGVTNIDMSGYIKNVTDISMNGILDNPEGHANFKSILIKDDGNGFIIDSSNNQIDISVLNAKDIVTDSLKVKEFTFDELTIDDVSFNNVSVSQKLDTSIFHLDSSVMSYSYTDENGSLHQGIINFHTGKNEFEAHPITVVYNTVEELFNDYNSGDLAGYDIKGSTYYVNNGLSSNNIKETFIIDNDGKLMPTTTYLVFNSDEITEELDASLTAYNYKAAGTMIFQHAYSSGSHYIDIPEGTNIEDGTAITGSEYHKLWQAVKEIQYVLGIDLDAGKISDTTDPTNIAQYGLRNIPTDVYGNEIIGIDSGELISDSSDYVNTYGKDASLDGIAGALLTNLYSNQKTAYIADETEEKPGFLVAIDEIIEEENAEMNGDDTAEPEEGETENPEGTTPDSNNPDGVYVPDIYDELHKDIDEIQKYFVRAMRIKRGTYTQLMDVSNYILDGELIWCKYDKNYPAQSNKLFIKTTDSRNIPYFFCINTGTDEESEGDYLTELKDIEKIDWKTDNGSTYRTVVDNDGNMHMQSLTTNTDIIVDSGKSRSKFYINSFYIGGLNADKNSFRPCTHNYIELSNLTGKDINLEDAKLTLQYTDRTLYNPDTKKVTWKILPLKGTIKNGETFLIRGKQCAPFNCNTTRIEINSYDMEWYDNGELISFDNACPSIVLCKSELTSDGTYKTCTADVDDIWQANYLYGNKAARVGMYDCIGVQGKVNGVNYGDAPLYTEADPVKPTYDGIYNTYDVLFMKYFAMDNVAQATTQETSRNNSKDIYMINLNSDKEFNLEKFYPGKASYEHKNIFYNKSDIGDTPEMIACSFGKIASDNGNGATRCFNWISKGYYNEYLELTYSDGYKEYYESFKHASQNNIFTGQEKEDFICEVNEHERFHYQKNGFGIYDRYRTFTTSGTPITVHKLIIDGIPAGEYTYRIGRKGHWSDEYSFIIKTDAELLENGFTFIHHSDQQGFNKNEYIAWKHTADFIDMKYDFDFTINTGDMTQNGNRISEWLDYYNAGLSIFKHTAQMNTVGNNDLAPKDNTKLGTGSDDSKINPKNFDLFYCHDLSCEEQDLLAIELPDHTYKLLPACYSVDYGNLHLVGINSELTWMAIEQIYEQDRNTQTIATQVENWLDNDFKAVAEYNAAQDKENQKWIITYCHEMPFTILTEDFLTSTKRVDRSEVSGKSAGCHWNYIPSMYQDGTKHCYWLSRLMEKYHVPVMLGGHKHTYSTSARIKENIKSEADYTNTYRPIIQLNRADLKVVYGDLSDDELRAAWYATGQKQFNKPEKPNIFERNICDVNDIEIVDEFNAPMYIMTQATGYKVISNKENPGTSIPWLSIPTGSKNGATDKLSQTYYPVQPNNKGELKVNSGQLYPMFGVWNIYKDKMECIPYKMSMPVEGKTSQIFYTGNTSADGLFRLVNETDYNPDNKSEWNPDNVDGMSDRKTIVITNKPY